MINSNTCQMTLGQLAIELNISLEELSFFITKRMSVKVPPVASSYLENYIVLKCRSLTRNELSDFLERNKTKIDSPFKESKSVMSKATAIEINRRKH